MDEWAGRGPEEDDQRSAKPAEEQFDVDGWDHDGNDDSHTAGFNEQSLPNDDDSELARKRAKDKKIMKYAGIGLGVFVLVVSGLVMMKPSPQPVEAPQNIRPVAQAVAPVVIDETREGDLATLPASQVAPVAQVAPVGPVTPMASMSANQGAITGPAVVKPAPPVQAASDQMTAAPVKGGLNDDSYKVIAEQKSQIAELQAKVETLNGQLNEKNKLIAELHSRPMVNRNGTPKPAAALATTPTARPIVKTAAAPVTASKVKAEVTTEKAEVNSPLVVRETKPTPSFPPATTQGGRVRNEFTVYAISNGRAWITWAKDGMNYTVGVNSELPDSSRVSRIDDSTGVVYTSGGEIHPKPPTK
jgi:hypothetical protein